ncbi:hypothetical protein DKX38_024321 [Salix brachista]|uniref:Uncharacterized protein n=1 Tax=Salix brachista TaxID=2182728 RepID=A0A5N5JLY2_9ROSI|nr:hypothetical protein DKX38_024321 [Salix brachista]
MKFLMRLMCDQPIKKVAKSQVNEGRKKFPLNSVRSEPSSALYIYHSRRLTNLWWNFADLKSHLLHLRTVGEVIPSYFLSSHFIAKRVDFSSFYFFICWLWCHLSGTYWDIFLSTSLSRNSIFLRLWWVYKLWYTENISRSPFMKSQVLQSSSSSH